jgi:hypothetical protein
METWPIRRLRRCSRGCGSRFKTETAGRLRFIRKIAQSRADSSIGGCDARTCAASHCSAIITTGTFEDIGTDGSIYGHRQSISAFGGDEQGELYLADLGGTVSRITAEAAPFQIRAVTSAASFVGGLSSGSIGTILTTFLPGVATTIAAKRYPRPTSLGAVSARVNGTAVPLYAMTPTQINFPIPYTLPSVQAEVNVVANGASGPSSVISLNAMQPALFSGDG